MLYSKLVSFDFFDTLCGRRCSDPEDIFKLVGKSIGIDGFAEARIDAQEKAFTLMHSKKKKTIHIRDIYECLSIEEANIDKIMKTEVMHELDQSIVNQDICRIYKECIECNNTLVAITSDMYLDSSFFVQCLEKHEIPLPDIILISCEQNAKKRDDGSLFDLLLKKAADHGISDVIHIGDNVSSDIQNALKRNIRAILYSSSSSSALDICSTLRPQHRSIMTYTRMPEVRYPHFISADVIHSLAIVTRQLVEFCLTKSKELAVQSIMFAARDGYILSELWKRLGYDKKHGIDGFYFPCSRAVAIKCGSAERNYRDFSEQFTSGIKGLLTSDLFDRMGLECVPVSCLEELGLQRRLYAKSEIFAENVCHIFKSQILSQIATEKNALSQYLEGIGVLRHSASKLLLFDIGWTGTSQLFLSKYFAELGVEAEGVYLALDEGSSRVEERRKSMRMHSACLSLGLPSVISKAVFTSRLLFEYFFSAAHPTILGFKRYNREHMALDLLYDDRSSRSFKKSGVHSGAHKLKLLSAIVDMAKCIDPAQASVNFSGSLVHLISCAQSDFLNSLPGSQGFDGWTYTISGKDSLAENQ